jgi:nicotinamide-nucleotide adenylyltransferase
MGTKTWLFITRCQPGFHDGHIDSLREALAAGIEKLIVWVGSADKEFTKDNPFTYNERKHMIELSLKEKLPGVVVEIYPIPHSTDSEQWKNYILKNLPDFEYVISDNPLVKEWFKTTDKIFFQTSITTDVRSSILRNKIAMGDYQYLYKVLTQEVVEYLKSLKADQRMQHILKEERVTPNIVVDAVLVDAQWNIVLIERKNAPLGIALPWGFVAYGEGTEQACIRKVKEETGAEVQIKRLGWNLW